MTALRYLSIVVLAAAGLALTASGASAARFYSDNPGASFSGSPRATSTYTVWNSAHTAQYTIGCLNQSYTGVKPSGASGLLSVSIQPSSCSVTIGGVNRAVTPEACGSAWAFSVASYNSTTGAGSGDLENCDGLVFHIDSLSFCWISYYWTAVIGAAKTQDRNAVDTANTTHTSAGGMRLKWTNVPMGYTTNCPGIQSSVSGQLSGEGFIPGVWAGP